MNTLTHDPVNPPDPQAATPYFRIRRALDEAAADRGLPPEPWAT
jgi:hypothetical protein